LPNLLLNRYTAAEKPNAETPTATKTADGSTPNKRKITLSIAVKMMRLGIYLTKDTSSVDEPSTCWKKRRKDIPGTYHTTLLLISLTTGEHRNFLGHYSCSRYWACAPEELDAGPRDKRLETLKS
jgi:hypothetical protein